jgi:hypothetical protein
MSQCDEATMENENRVLSQEHGRERQPGYDSEFDSNYRASSEEEKVIPKTLKRQFLASATFKYSNNSIKLFKSNDANKERSKVGTQVRFDMP